MSDQVYVGVDLGGTNIKVGICDQDGNLLHKMEGPTEAEGGANKVVENIARYAHQLVDQSPYRWEQVAGIGTGIPGFTDVKNGIVKMAPNLLWKNVPIKSMLEDLLQKKVRIDNDANVAALGEALSGAGKGIDHIVLFTLGTGVGGGIINNGKIVQGFSGVAGELGHLQVVPDLEAIQCGCGQMGCVETVSSATGIVRMAKDAVERGDRTQLNLLETITAKDVFDAARAGDEVALRIIQRAAFYLGKTMAIIALSVNPERFIIGGGVSRAGDVLFDPIREYFLKYTPEPAREGVSIVPAQLGNDAGMIGAAGLLLR
ncbi:MAG TPA: ROK family glucokinase [Bacilli bacterium]